MMRAFAVNDILRRRGGLLAAVVLAACASLAGAQSDPASSPEEPTESTTVERAEVATAADSARVGDAQEAASDDAAAGEDVTPTVEHLTRLETRIEFVELVENDEFEQALPLAETIVELTEADFGRPSIELATAINNLAVVQRNLRLYEESKASYLDAIEMYREVEGPFTESIITPLVALGANYHATGDYAQALGLFQEARTVNRRSYGLLNPDQIDIVYHIATTLGSMRRYEDALRQQEDALRLMERVYGANTMEVLPYVSRFADWLAATFLFEPARFQYARAMNIIRTHEGPESVALVDPLREIGNSYRVQKLAEGRGISSLKRALDIAENAAERDPLIVARVLRDIGDWYTAFSRINATGAEYRRAWQILGELDDADEIRTRWFDSPDYVLREYPSSRGLLDADDPGAEPGFVRLSFDVDESGDVRNVVVLESDPPGFKDDAMLRAMRRSRFRPRLVNGELVYSTGLIRTFTYHYEPAE